MNTDQTKAIIVYNDSIAKYAHLMTQLITAYTTCEVVEWDENVWKSNKVTVSSSEKVLFLGGTSEKYKLGISWIHDKFNMRYGWLGNHCVIDVIIDILKFNVFSFDEFIKYYNERIAQYENKVSTPYAKEETQIILTTFLVGLTGVASIPLSLTMTLNEVRDRQFILLVIEFVLGGGLKTFLED